jgi:hypothetical protein
MGGNGRVTGYKCAAVAIDLSERCEQRLGCMLSLISRFARRVPMVLKRDSQVDQRRCVYLCAVTTQPGIALKLELQLLYWRRS